MLLLLFLFFLLKKRNFILCKCNSIFFLSHKMDRIRKPFETRTLPDMEKRRPSLVKRLVVTSALIGALFAVAAYRKENLIDSIPHLWTVWIFWTAQVGVQAKNDENVDEVNVLKSER